MNLVHPDAHTSIGWLCRNVALFTILAVPASLNPQSRVSARTLSVACYTNQIPAKAGLPFAAEQSWVGNRVVQAVSLWSTYPLRLHFGPGAPHGFGQKVVWRIRPSLRHDVTLTGYNFRTEVPMQFQVETTAALGPTHPLRVGRLSWRTPSISSLGSWRGYSSSMFVPGSGCYVLHAHWQGGGWSLRFVAGTGSN